MTTAPFLAPAKMFRRAILKSGIPSLLTVRHLKKIFCACWTRRTGIVPIWMCLAARRNANAKSGLFPPHNLELIMEPALQRRIQRYGWDKAAIYYEAFWVKQLKPAQDLLLEMAHLQEGEKVLESACGTGLVSFKAREKVTEKGLV